MAQKLRILLVEDDERDRRAIVRMLRSAGISAEVEERDDCAGALEALGGDGFDCAIVDHRLPDGDSVRLLRELSRAGRFGVPIVVLTGLNEQATATAALQHGAQDYLVKGQIDANALARSIRYAVERHHLLVKLRESQQILQCGLDALAAYIAVLDGKGRIIAVNEAWRRFAIPGYPFGASWGLECNYLEACERMPDEEGASARAIAEKIAEGLAQEGERSLEYSWTVSGRTRWFLARVNRVPGTGPARIVVAHEDCTGRRQAERQSRERMEEVAVLNHRLAARKAELATYHDLLTHDVSNFAMATLAISERLLAKVDGSLTARQEELLRRARRQGLEVSRIAENARLLGDVRDRGLPGTVAPIVVGDALQDAVRTVRALHFDRPFNVATECPEDLSVVGVPFLQSILSNLVDNAVRHTPSERRPSLRVQAWAEGATVWISIRGGAAPPKEIFSHLFERYVRGHGSKGLGLGLALVREIIERTGGTVEARSVSEGGMETFEVLLRLSGAKASQAVAQ
ncbi:MAG: response regulator [Planctomycetes bacterium]|nr:response regulator [Planctomycetota bacterium]